MKLWPTSIMMPVLVLCLSVCRLVQGGEAAAASLPNGSEPPPAADASYLLGPEDMVKISVWKDEHLTQEVVVRPDGMISFPLVGDIPAAGRTVEDLRLELVKRLAKFMPNPHVSVLATKILSYKIYVIGRVNKPGEFLVGHYTDVLQALSLAGGLTPFAAENDIRVMRRDRGEQRVFQFRYGDVRKGKDLSQNIILERGDVVVVP
ncbi:polysaccharide biosynthesis/export family protein [Nitrospira moscoviensis]|uniref:Putative polysaccharide export protein n=1 Tax=Nitrospira moscoviensis TaxID=42253 RepID=A0A0K2GJK0_NITMO|nr:polysaccharide biosynthesis/export family protein [Nitrospira moscoviensis]ALA61133.1 putative polysaccharide export protein [Nitrospira moscoviensis]